jgi:adenosylmethionine-8-amino-7-oxononanoate aminotransferase
MSASVSGSDYLTDTFGRHPNCKTITSLNEITTDTAAVIIETCSWQAGLNDLGKEYFTQLRQVCDDTGALLIIDDIAFCGGKTGTMFGFQVYDIKPDIFCIGKGITGGYFPLSATLCNQRVADVVKPQTLLHGFSYSFPMAGIISVLKYLTILEREQVLLNQPAVVANATEFFDKLKTDGYINDYKSFGVCFKLVLNHEIPDYLEKERLFYKHGLHMGLWNNDKTGVLIMLPINACSSYFNKLSIRLRSVLADMKS